MSAEDDGAVPEGRDLIREASPLVVSYAADDIALAALTRRQDDDAPLCHACDARLDGATITTGLLVWARGEELVTEEPPLCPACSAAIGLTALRRFALEDDEEG